MTPSIVKRAVWKKDRQSDIKFSLFRRERADFRWIDEATATEWDKVAYLDQGTAIKAMRLHVETHPSCVGVDITVFDVAPPAAQRAAEAVLADMRGIEDYLAKPSRLDDLTEIIERETNASKMAEAFSTLIAFLITRRPSISFGLAASTMPPQVIEQINRAIAVTGQMPGRNLTLDGLLYEAIEQLGKSTGQDFTESLLKPLKEPVSKIVQATAMPKLPPGGIQ